MPIVSGTLPGRVDVAVIGAGAAGLAAARRLLASGRLSVLVIEAGPRLGGRAHTVPAPDSGVPIDLGCAWLHAGKTNAWTAIAPTIGFTVDRRPAPWDFGEVDSDLSPGEEASFEREERAFYDRVAAALAEGRDPPMGDLVAADGRWRPLLDAISTYVNGTELAQVSSRDHDNYRPGEGADWRVVEGYGALVAAYGSEVPVVLDTAVTLVDHTGATAVRLETARGSLEAEAVVITASTDVLAGEVLRFRPALPEKVDAAARLPLGLADKLWLSLDPSADVPAETYRVGSSYRARTGAYLMRPFGRPVIEAFWGGALARDIEAAGAAEAFRFATEELVGLFGGEIARKIAPLRATAWGREPFIRGSYSFAQPGAADRRATLAAPVDGRLFFAGEACSPHRFTTAHGAFETGVAAAEAVLQRDRG